MRILHDVYEHDFGLAAALIVAAVYAYSAIASAPTATPAIVNNDITTVNGAFTSDSSEVL